MHAIFGQVKAATVDLDPKDGNKVKMKYERVLENTLRSEMIELND